MRGYTHFVAIILTLHIPHLYLKPYKMSMSKDIYFDAPFDIVTCIFAHLPVKVLLRYRSVSKPYCDLIDSRFFANMHCGHSIRTRSNRYIVFMSEGIQLSFGSDAGIHRVDFSTLKYNSVLQCPIEWDYFTKFIGTCNGVVLLYDGYKDIVFWNPTIRTYIDVNPPRGNMPEDSYGKYKYNFGLGYDKLKDDYKVVMSVQMEFTAVLNGEDCVRDAYVFSLKSNVWRRIGDFPYFVRKIECHGTYVDGSLYWICVKRTFGSNFRNLIVAFDLATEKYRVIQRPVYENISSEVEIVIGSLEDSLWAHCYIEQPNLGSGEDPVGIADVWLLHRREEEYSWTKLVSFDDPNKYCKPLAYSKCGKNLLLDNQMNLLWYNLVKGQKGRNINIRGLPAYYGSDVCVESLVHLDGGASDEVHEENQRRREKKMVEDVTGRSNEDSIFSVVANFVTTLIREIFEP